MLVIYNFLDIINNLLEGKKKSNKTNPDTSVRIICGLRLTHKVRGF